MGPNGSGKTTLLRILLGEEEPTRARSSAATWSSSATTISTCKALPDDKPVIRAVWPEPDPEIDEQRMRRPAGPLRPDGRPGLPAGRQAVRRRAQPGGAGPAGGPGRQRAGARRADQPPRPLGLRRPGAGAAGVRGDGHRRQPRPLFPQPRRRSADRAGRRRPGPGDPRQLRHLRAHAGLARRRRQPRKKGREAVESAARAAAAKAAKRKRRFPYRKTEEIEADIAATETQLRELEQLLASPDLYRDGDKVKETTKAFEETKATLAQLYEHWEEAVELN